MDVKTATKVIKDYYQFMDEKVKVVRKLKHTQEILDENDEVVQTIKMEAFLCLVTNERKKKTSTICTIGYDAHGELYASEYNYCDVGDEEKMIDDWKVWG